MRLTPGKGQSVLRFLASFLPGVSRWRRPPRPPKGAFRPWPGRRAAGWESPRRACSSRAGLCSVRSGGRKARHRPRPTCRPRGRASSPARGRRWRARGRRGHGGRVPCLGELLGLVAGVGELTEVELGEGELGLRSRVDFPTSRAMRTASWRLSAASPQWPCSSCHSPRRPCRSRMVTRFLPALASCSALVRCSSLRSPCQKRNRAKASSVSPANERWRLLGPTAVSGRRVEEFPHRFGVCPSANFGKLHEATVSSEENVLFVGDQSGEIKSQKETALRLCQAVLRRKRSSDMLTNRISE